MSLLPSSPPDVEATQEGEFNLLGLDDDATSAVLEALSPASARSILRAIHDEPSTPSALADRTDMSVQNVMYHLEKLEPAGLVQRVGTQYSEKGREMAVYGPADDPLVVFVGTDERKVGLRALLARFVGAVGMLAVMSLLLHSLIEGGLPFLSFTGAAGGGPSAAEPTVPLASAVFLGGVTVLLVVFAWRYWAHEIDAVLHHLGSQPLLVGRDPDRSRRAVIAAVAVALALAVLWTIVTQLAIVIPTLGPIGPAQAFVVALGGAAIVQAYSNDGLLINWLVVFVPVFGIGFGTVGIGLAAAGPDHIAGVIGYPVVLGAVGAALLGTAGFVIGAGLRRAIGRIGTGSSTPET